MNQLKSYPNELNDEKLKSGGGSFLPFLSRQDEALNFFETIKLYGNDNNTKSTLMIAYKIKEQVVFQSPTYQQKLHEVVYQAEIREAIARLILVFVIV